MKKVNESVSKDTKKATKDVDKDKEESPEKKQKPVIREVIIQTDGTNLKIVKNETAGAIELMGMFQTLMGYLANNK